MGLPKKDDISRDKTILMTSLRTYEASAVSRLGLHYTYSPPPIERSLCTLPGTRSHLSRQLFEILDSLSFPVSYCINNASASGKRSSIYLKA